MTTGRRQTLITIELGTRKAAKAGNRPYIQIDVKSSHHMGVMGGGKRGTQE